MVADSCIQCVAPAETAIEAIQDCALSDLNGPSSDQFQRRPGLGVKAESLICLPLPRLRTGRLSDVNGPPDGAAESGGELARHAKRRSATN